MSEDRTLEPEATGDETEEAGVSRRGALECMIWAGTGVLWTLSGGVPKSLGLLGDDLLGNALAAETPAFTFLQISDSHIGFNKPANPDALGTLRDAIAKIKAVPTKPAFMIHTGDITHLSKPDEFDNANQLISEAALDVHYVPGEHDFVDEGVCKAYLARYGKGTKGAGWYSFDDHGVHFIGLVNVVDLKAGGLGRLGPEQLAWLADDIKDKSNSTPMSCSRTSRSGRSMPIGDGAPTTACGRSTVEALWLGDCAQRPYPSDRAEGRRQYDLPHCTLHLLPAAGPPPCSALPASRCGWATSLSP
jgi:calcineurin-like phosphoesterase family protein